MRQIVIVLLLSLADYHLCYGKAISQQAMRASMLDRLPLAGRAKFEFERAAALDKRNVDARDALVEGNS